MAVVPEPSLTVLLFDLFSKIVVALPAIFFAWGAWQSSRKTHSAVNGRMDEFKRLMLQNSDMARQLAGINNQRKDEANEKQPNDAKPVPVNRGSAGPIS